MSALVWKSTGETPWAEIEDGSYTVVPGHVPALSKAGKAWFAAHRRNLARVTEPGDVKQDLGELRRVVRAFDWRKDGEERTLTKAEEAALNDKMRAVPGSLTTALRQLEVASLQIAAKAVWFAFDDLGAVVLSLKVNRERALELALAYNKAGGRLVMLAPSRDLASVPLEDCVAVAELTAPPPAPKLSPAEVFAGPDGAVYATPHGLVGMRVADEEKGLMDRSNMVLDPAVTDAARARKAKWNAPEPAAVVDVLDDLTPGEVLFDGSAARLPPALPANDKRKPGLVALGGYYFPRSVVAGLCKGKVTARATGPGYLWIERADGSVAVAAHCGRAE